MAQENIIKRLEEEGFDAEIAEIRREHFDYTGYPTPYQKYSLSYKAENFVMEEMYSWMVGHAMNDWSMPFIHKITDIFSASQSSAQFGDMGARLTAQQNQASQLLATVNNMSKDLFKKVRELRQIRERLGYYKKADETDLATRKTSAARGAENTLKDVWITVVEGGTEGPGSVYGMARKVGFTILPDLFFQAPPLTKDEVKKYAEALKEEYNPTVVLALERKLFQFIHWKDTTHQELDFKEKYSKRMIYQHWQNMKTYLNWIKPYLKNIKSLSSNADLNDAYGIISSFQGSMSEVEVLIQKPMLQLDHPEDSKKKVTVSTVLIIHIIHQTSSTDKPPEGYSNRVPMLGRSDVNVRTYGWTNEQIDKYKGLKTKEDIDLLQTIDHNLKDDGELLGDDLKQIIQEVEEEMGLHKPADEQNPETKTYTDLKKAHAEEIKRFRKEIGGPFTSLFKGVKEVTWDIAFGEAKRTDRKAAAHSDEVKKAQKSAAKYGNLVAWQVVKNYKKSHRLVSW
jgi:hypothetical protein